MPAIVTAVGRSPVHGFSKPVQDGIRLLAGLGVEGGPQGNLVRKAGIMAVVLEDGEVLPGDPITVELPPQPHEPLRPV